MCPNDIEHRLTKPSYPWTNGQVERLSRMPKVATVGRYSFDSHNQLRVYLKIFVEAYSYAKRLKVLTPIEFVAKRATTRPERFNKSTFHPSEVLIT